MFVRKSPPDPIHLMGLSHRWFPSPRIQRQFLFIRWAQSVHSLLKIPFFIHGEHGLLRLSQFFDLTQRRKLREIAQAEMFQKEFRRPIHDRTTRLLFSSHDTHQLTLEQGS